MSGPFKMKGSPMKRNFGIGASPAKQDEKKKRTETVKTIEIPKEHIVPGEKNPFGGPVLKSPGEGGPKRGTGVIWNKEEIKKMKERFPSPMKQGVYTKEGDKKAKAAKKQYISEARDLKKSNIKVLKKAKKSGYAGAKDDIKAERKKYRTTKKAIKKGYREAKKKAKNTKPKTYTGPATGKSA
jgi:hypothetical protein